MREQQKKQMCPYLVLWAHPSKKSLKKVAQSLREVLATALVLIPRIVTQIQMTVGIRSVRCVKVAI